MENSVLSRKCIYIVDLLFSLRILLTAHLKAVLSHVGRKAPVFYMLPYVLLHEISILFSAVLQFESKTCLDPWGGGR